MRRILATRSLAWLLATPRLQAEIRTVTFDSKVVVSTHWMGYGVGWSPYPLA
jgi:hypothetical protein